MIKNCSPGFYGDAPAAIVVGLDKGSDTNGVIGLLDIGFTAENILLAIHALGLGGCAVASFIEPAIKKVINAPDKFRPILIFSVGYPDKEPSMPSKKKLSDIVYINEYGKNWEKLEGSI
ncbi:unnamed protein product [marine sediment metagenome]|uniref:Nitroreductase domain-containing protein n=1 Tax=marine sediment metagenome TaxID=412755 RepID=X1A8S2_9ZZZZ